ncbi:Nkp2p KNAG_0C05870 [Huiozyma naganishii CBS 8797]|uniref:Uncharacterized protein n=1 Tax=Huiozyma naganishii (strain ATCC MYA-139 / BCRC 22969 / CBS 8797 / KCTC 17520 / NBRC 10181 / NCYC 3082 / Yp74L-3) TaxID=1071383 RepID=J7R4B1_HUIN7|nr:hypothetical protein KNAG_0C05870 [Kazachstania naganishii CBS 8797]CCK69685.1 hypothetical protein KNAG_0C05870 [Kazachstania naganishii CBS 8797]
MSAEGVLQQFIEGLLTTKLLCYSEFQHLIKTHNEEVQEEDIQEWYNMFQSNDGMLLRNTSSTMNTLMRDLESADINDLKEFQAKDNFSLDELVNNLYSVGTVLDTQLSQVNVSIEKETVALALFEQEVATCTETRGNGSSIKELLYTLNKYEKTVEAITANNKK